MQRILWRWKKASAESFSYRQYCTATIHRMPKYRETRILSSSERSHLAGNCCLFVLRFPNSNSKYNRKCSIVSSFMSCFSSAEHRMSHQSSFEQVLRIIFLNVQRDSSLLWVCHITTSAWELFQNPLPPVAPVTKVSGGNQNSEQTSHQANAWSLVAVVASSL